MSLFGTLFGALLGPLLIGGIGIQELLVLFLILVLLFGATKLPQIGRGLGEAIRNFKGGLKSDDGGGSEKIEDGQSSTAPK